MELFEVTTTEHNGEQEYWGSYIVAARDIDQAKKRARKYFKNWYEDGCDKRADPDDPDSFEFMGGHILLTIDNVVETTLENWVERQVELLSIGRLPRARFMCHRCKVLLNACQHVRDCLDVGGEQSRQFAEEIAYLKKAISDARI